MNIDIQKAYELFYSRDFEQAGIYVARGLESEPDNISGQLLVARLLLIQQEYDEACKIFRFIYEKHRHNLTVLETNILRNFM